MLKEAETVSTLLKYLECIEQNHELTTVKPQLPTNQSGAKL